ncbi:T9SS type A sorting domain-containing protein, partial [Mariniflexile sp. HNIBRBA6329]|uniref:T9SS type A sorting domain-containing protein n=1 Tax=Mariniflexile sp. HNIBRBA6329 TaxID=3373088 RepID=UPI003744E32E
GDGTNDCEDLCPANPNKTDPGVCGCGVVDMDTDNDGVLDCNDQEINSPCPNDVNANGVSNDTDGDGTPNCQDGCPSDPNKTSPGVCGCGVADTDTDSDGVLDCNDQEINSPCPNDVNANGVSNDTDGDGTPNCQDTCDNSIDSDGDGTNDCEDLCPANPNKTDPGVCGCGTPDTDSDGDGVADCSDLCPGFDDTVDSDSDGIPDGCDGTLSIESFDFKNIIITPNPFSSNIILELPHKYKNLELHIVLYDMSGRIILRKDMIIDENRQTITNLEYLNQGVYVIKISSNTIHGGAVKYLVKY